MLIASQKMTRLTTLATKITKCEKCFVRNEKIWFTGVGNPASKLMFIGEAPSIHRDFNLPFGMKSRKVFEEILTELGQTRETVWTTNVVKCIRLHKHTGILEKCVPYLREEIDIINPESIILFGREVVDTVMQMFTVKPSDVRIPLNGHCVNHKEYRFITMYHPMTVIYHPEFRNVYFNIVKKIETFIQRPKGA